MRVGIVFPDWRPEDGGSSSLLNTIYKEVLEFDNNDIEIYILYHGQKADKYIKKNNITLLNIDFYFGKTPLEKIINSKKKNFRVYDLITKNEGIDFLYLPYPMSVDTDCPYIATIWDLGHRTVPYFPEVSVGKWGYAQREKMYQDMVYKASYIITGNNTGKKEIIENYSIPEEKVVAVPFPIAEFCYGKETKPSFELPEEYFFYPAQFWAHKNHICIIEALKYLKNEKSIFPKIYLTGSDKGNRKYIEEKIKEYNLENQIVFTGFVSDEELKYLYTHATAIIFASLMGPNNMPPIEATYLNCPVIITDLEGHKEQLKDTALYFDGLNPEDLAEKMLTMLNNKKLREEIKKKEKVLSEEFENINYFKEVYKYINRLAQIIKTWK